MSEMQDAIVQLEEAGLLTRRQAEAFVMRELYKIPRRQVAEELGITMTVVDKHLGRARAKIEAADETVLLVAKHARSGDTEIEE